MINLKREIAAVLVAATVMAQIPQAFGRRYCDDPEECGPTRPAPPPPVPAAVPPAGEPIVQSAMALRQPEFLSLGGSPETISAAELVTNSTKRQTLINVFGAAAGSAFADGAPLDKAFVELLRQVQRTGSGTVGAGTLRAAVTIDAQGNINGRPLASDSELAVTSHLIDLTRSEREAALRQVGVDPQWFDERTILNFFNRVEIRRQLGGPGAAALDFANVEVPLQYEGEGQWSYQTVTIGARFTVRADGAIIGVRGTWERPTSEKAYGQRRDAEHREWPGGLPELRDRGPQDTYSRLYRQAATLSPEVKALVLRSFGLNAEWTTRAYPAELAEYLARARTAMTVAGQANIGKWYGYPSLTLPTSGEDPIPDDLFYITLNFASDGQGHVNGRVPLSESAIATQMAMERMTMVEKRLLLRQAGLPFEAVRTIPPLTAATVLTTVTMFQKEPGDHTYKFDANGAHWLGAVSVAGDGSIIGGAAVKLPPEPKWWEEALGPILAIVSLAFPAVAPYAAVINAGVQVHNGARGIQLFASIASAAAGVSAISDSAQGLATASTTTQNLTVIATALNATSSLNSAIKNKDVLGIFVSMVSLADSVGTMTNTRLDSSFDLVRQAAKVADLVRRVRDGDIVGLGTQVIAGFQARAAAALAPSLVYGSGNSGVAAYVASQRDASATAAELQVQDQFNQALYNALSAGQRVFMFDKGDGNGAQPYVTSAELDFLAVLLRSSKDANQASLAGSNMSPYLQEYSDAAPVDPNMQRVLFTQELDLLKAASDAMSFQRLAELNQVDAGTASPNPSSRLGAYEATRGYAAGTVGYAVHNAIGVIYQALGTFGEIRIGDVFYSNEAKALMDLPLTAENSRRIAAMEFGYWAAENQKDPSNMGARLGASFSVQQRSFLQMYIFSTVPLRFGPQAPPTPPRGPLQP